MPADARRVGEFEQAVRLLLSWVAACVFIVVAASSAAQARVRIATYPVHVQRVPVFSPGSLQHFVLACKVHHPSDSPQVEVTNNGPTIPAGKMIDFYIPSPSFSSSFPRLDKALKSGKSASDYLSSFVNTTHCTAKVES